MPPGAGSDPPARVRPWRKRVVWEKEKCVRKADFMDECRGNVAMELSACPFTTGSPTKPLGSLIARMGEGTRGKLCLSKRSLILQPSTARSSAKLGGSSSCPPLLVLPHLSHTVPLPTPTVQVAQKHQQICRRCHEHQPPRQHQHERPSSSSSRHQPRLIFALGCQAPSHHDHSTTTIHPSDHHTPHGHRGPAL